MPSRLLPSAVQGTLLAAAVLALYTLHRRCRDLVALVEQQKRQLKAEVAVELQENARQRFGIQSILALKRSAAHWRAPEAVPAVVGHEHDVRRAAEPAHGLDGGAVGGLATRCGSDVALVSTACLQLSAIVACIRLQRMPRNGVTARSSEPGNRAHAFQMTLVSTRQTPLK